MLSQNQCYGRNRNWRRCGRFVVGKWFCPDHKWQPWCLLVFILFTVIPALIGYKNYLSPQLESKPAIPDPIIKSYIEHPVMTEESPPRINKKNPDAIIHNDGAVSAVSVRGDLWFLSFKEDQVDSAGSYGRSPHGPSLCG